MNYIKPLRSLLQKAIRRGNYDIAELAFAKLYNTDNKNWLYHRLAIISAEECWPICLLFKEKTSFKEYKNILSLITRAPKNKSAAGLGTLSYVLSTGNYSVLKGTKEDSPIRLICAAIERPNDFWPWLKGQCENISQFTVTDNLFRIYKRGGLPWDKAFLITAAYLSVIYPENCKNVFDEVKTADLPLWVAFDKHTEEGRKALKRTSNRFNLNYEMLGYVNFYIESCKCNEILYSYWWEREVNWRLSTYGLTVDDAIELWNKIKPYYISELLPSQKLLLDYLTSDQDKQIKMDYL